MSHITFKVLATIKAINFYVNETDLDEDEDEILNQIEKALSAIALLTQHSELEFEILETMEMDYANYYESEV